MSDATSSNDPIIDEIQRTISNIFSDGPNQISINSLPGGKTRGHTIWKVTTPTGRCLAVKQQPFAPLTRNTPYDLLEVEKTVCRLLHAEGCPIPEVYATQSEYSLIFFDWCGDLTLDDVCQESSKSVWSPLGKQTIEGFVLVQNTFQMHTTSLSEYTFPGCDPKSLLESWRETIDELKKAIPCLATHFNSRSKLHSIPHYLWKKVLTDLETTPPTLGVTDYNARNVVVNSESSEIRFIEFSKLGWDWPERRLVQYTTSLGSGRSNGQFRSLLCPRTTACYADLLAHSLSENSGTISHRLDAHHLIFHLLIGSRLLGAISAPKEGRNSDLLKAWKNPKTRLKQLQKILSTPLSNNSEIKELRALFSNA